MRERGRELCAPQIFLHGFCAPLSQLGADHLFFSRLCPVPVSIKVGLSTYGGRSLDGVVNFVTGVSARKSHAVREEEMYVSG